MDLYKDILIDVLSKQKIRVHFENLKTEDSNEIVEVACYKTIQGIRKVLDNDEFDDFECVEKIVELLEGIGSNGGSRHDFG